MFEEVRIDLVGEEKGEKGDRLLFVLSWAAAGVRRQRQPGFAQTTGYAAAVFVRLAANEDWRNCYCSQTVYVCGPIVPSPNHVAGLGLSRGYSRVGTVASVCTPGDIPARASLGTIRASVRVESPSFEPRRAPPTEHRSSRTSAARGTNWRPAPVAKRPMFRRIQPPPACGTG